MFLTLIGGIQATYTLHIAIVLIKWTLGWIASLLFGKQ